MKSRWPETAECGPATVPAAPACQPNELDRRRIMRLLDKRTRYQYVSPLVEPMPGGYRIVSPCCSRNIDSGGGPIDIARIEYDDATRIWTLSHKDHLRGVWREHARAERLDLLVSCLLNDPARLFWQ